MENTERQIADTLKRLMQLLVNADFESVQRLSGGARLSANMIREAISEYGHKLVMPPERAYSNIDAIEVTDSTPRRWSVTFPLWSADEGRSDLALECTLTESGYDMLDVEIDGIHVL